MPEAGGLQQQRYSELRSCDFAMDFLGGDVNNSF